MPARSIVSGNPRHFFYDNRAVTHQQLIVSCAASGNGRRSHTGNLGYIEARNTADFVRCSISIIQIENQSVVASHCRRHGASIDVAVRVGVGINETLYIL